MKKLLLTLTLVTAISFVPMHADVDVKATGKDLIASIKEQRPFINDLISAINIKAIKSGKDQLKLEALYNDYKDVDLRPLFAQLKEHTAEIQTALDNALSGLASADIVKADVASQGKQYVADLTKLAQHLDDIKGQINVAQALKVVQQKLSQVNPEELNTLQAKLSVIKTNIDSAYNKLSNANLSSLDKAATAAQELMNNNELDFSSKDVIKQIRAVKTGLFEALDVITPNVMAIVREIAALALDLSEKTEQLPNQVKQTLIAVENLAPMITNQLNKISADVKAAGVK